LEVVEQEVQQVHLVIILALKVQIQFLIQSYQQEVVLVNHIPLVLQCLQYQLITMVVLAEVVVVQLLQQDLLLVAQGTLPL
tara:strand:- start:377 stop:619 length:243 start_codon:yes stop_codon:yes gene_type:complete